MRIAIVDDNELERNHALPLLFEGFKEINLPIARLDFFSDTASFLEKWVLGSYDLLILDIMIGVNSGIDLAHEVRKHNHDIRIVFCSNSNEYAAESYAVNACFYLQKPVTLDGIRNMIRRLDIADYELRRFVVMPDEQRVILRNIIYTEYSNHMISIHCRKGEIQKTWLSQSAFWNLISSYPFFYSCNKGNIVNLYEVAQWRSDAFIMTNQAIIPISRRKQKDAEAAYRSFMFKSIREELS